MAAKVARQFFPLPPRSDGPILRNWNGYSQESQQRILAAYVDLVEGRLRPEPKQREPLVGLWTVKINAADRIIVDDLPGGGWVLLGAVFDHNYALAEQQIAGWLAWRQRTASAAALATVVEEFQRDYGQRLLDPFEAHDRCQDYSEEFASRCKEAGVEAEVVSGLKFGEMPEFPGQRLVLGGHFAVQVGPMVYDWTARQFDPTAPVPMVTTIDQWRDEWLRLGFRSTALSAADAYRWEQNIRNTGNVQTLSRDECERLLQRILVDHGFPQGEYAEITEARSLGTSQVAWFMDTNPPTPAIALDTRMQDDITVIHEAAHILRNGPSMAGQQGGVDRDAAHDAQWLTTFKALVQVYAGEQTKKTFNRIFG